MSKNIIFQQPLKIQQESSESESSINELISFDSFILNDQSSDDEYYQILTQKDQQIQINKQTQNKQKKCIFQNQEFEIQKKEVFRIHQIKNIKENNFQIFFEFVQSDNIDTLDNQKLIHRNFNQFIQPVNSFTNLIKNEKDHSIQIKILNGAKNIGIGIIPFKIKCEPHYNKQITFNLNWLAYDIAQNFIVQNGNFTNYGSKFEDGDVIDIQFFPKLQQIHFAKNLVSQGKAFDNVVISQYHLIITLKKPNDSVQIIGHKEI